MQSFRNYRRPHPSKLDTQMTQKSAMRILNTSDSDTLLSGFPTTRLSYEVSIHKNDTHHATTSRDYKYFILPKGRRCIAWATEWKSHRIFAFIDIDNMNNNRDRDRDRDRVQVRPFIQKFHQENGWYPSRVRIIDACFDRTLVYGTVFAGIMFRNTETAPAPTHATNVQFFSIHTIYWYKANPVPPLTGCEYIRLCEEIFYNNQIRQVAYTKENSVIFGLPVLCNTEQDAQSMVSQLPYETFAIQYRHMTNTNVFQKVILPTMAQTHAPARAPAPAPAPAIVISRVSTTSTAMPPQVPASKRVFVPPQDEMLTNIQMTFIVRPNIQNDIYELFVMSDHFHNREPIFHNFALIPSFKTSVMMNRLFRNITENERLDTMEESEDECDFENTELDKDVTLTKEYKMICRFNKRFCKWVPIDMNTKADVVTAQQVRQHEVRYIRHRK